MVWPLGEVPTTAPCGDELLTGGLVGHLESGAAQALTRGVLRQPGHAGHRPPGAPSTYRGSVGGNATSP
ncbi:hypothetical protein MMUR_65950 [Mycolicibacterium murale]|uniref:Uncharacterized protein n=1 Tax=Mycolicibacterium murale TaxID=182220 RepID=A0A7I9WXU3_9MYCO|nr:hypothetical protein MMUR_65950 [Mycolicibacterium murale]